MPSMYFLLLPGNGSARAFYNNPLEFLSDPRPWFVAVTCNGGGSTVTATRVDSVISDIIIPCTK